MGEPSERPCRICGRTPTTLVSFRTYRATVCGIQCERFWRSRIQERIDLRIERTVTTFATQVWHSDPDAEPREHR